jgi:drug/metabolite transporter (DMT)-like permease
MAALGLIGAGAQYMIIESYRLAPASLVAPFEYTSLVWAFALTYLIWADIPRAAVFAGAAVIILSGLLTVAGEWRAGRVAPPMNADRSSCHGLRQEQGRRGRAGTVSVDAP